MDTAAVLKAARFNTKSGAPHPFYLVQLNSSGELPLSGEYVSDALVEHIKTAEPPFTHVFLQTHGWNTPPDKAIRVPFSEFMAGMQNDPNVPKDDSFKPLFVGFTWEALPLKFMKEEDALKRSELLEESMAECEVKDPKLVDASREIRKAAETKDTKNDHFKLILRALADSDSDDDDNEGAVAELDAKIAADARSGNVEVADQAFEINPIAKILDPLQRLVFGRLISRGRRTGRVLQRVVSKLMLARPNPSVKFCLMANSLGAHVVSGALMSPSILPYKMHCAFIVQGAANSEWFGDGGKYSSVRENVAGPVMCTVSAKDHLLRNVFAPFHGDAVGNCGFPNGGRIDMVQKDRYGDSPYTWLCGDWNSVESTQFIDEGNPFVGGHGDFKEDETTMTYWSAINVNIEPQYYLTERSPEVVRGEMDVPPPQEPVGRTPDVDKSSGKQGNKGCVLV